VESTGARIGHGVARGRANEGLWTISHPDKFVLPEQGRRGTDTSGSVWLPWAPVSPTPRRPKGESVITGPRYEKGQQCQKVLSFAVPRGWVKDEEAAKKFGLQSVLVPAGMTWESAGRLITISFQKKDAHKSGFENLETFFKVDLQDTRARFPDAQFAKWQPSKLDPGRVDFMSMEMYGKARNKPSPQRFVILDAGDGYFSISLTVGTRSDLQLPIDDEFFNSLGVASR
jgi:hypothetical protein